MLVMIHPFPPPSFTHTHTHTNYHGDVNNLQEAYVLEDTSSQSSSPNSHSHLLPHISFLPRPAPAKSSPAPTLTDVDLMIVKSRGHVAVRRPPAATDIRPTVSALLLAYVGQVFVPATTSPARTRVYAGIRVFVLEMSP